MSNRIKETIQAGQRYTYSGPGNYIACYAATAEIDFSVETDATRFDGLPLDQGTGFIAPFKRVILENNTNEPVTVEVIVMQVAGLPIKGYYDNREVAASIAVDGGVVTNTAPSIDLGGSVIEIGESYFQTDYNNAGGAAGDFKLITSAMNLTGVRIRHFDVWIRGVGASTGIRAIRRLRPGPQNLRFLNWTGADVGQVLSFSDTFDLPAGHELSVYMFADDYVTVFVRYDNI